MMKKVGTFFCCFLPIIVALVCQLVVGFAFSFVLSFIAGFKTAQAGITDPAATMEYMTTNLLTGNTIILVTIIATAVTILIGVLWYRSYKPAEEFSLKKVMNGKFLLAMVLMGLSLQLLISTCLRLVLPVLPESMMEGYQALIESLMGQDVNVVLSLIATVICAPIAEEFLYRGVTMKMAQKIMPFMAANILQAVLFGVYHMNLIQGVYAFALGLILGFTAEYFHSIWASILLHAFINGSAELLGHLPAAISETVAGAIGYAVVGVALLIVAAKLYPLGRKEQVVLAATAENENFTENSFDEQ